VVNPFALGPLATLIRIRLTQSEAERLEHSFRQTTDRTLRDRLKIILRPTEAARIGRSPPSWAPRSAVQRLCREAGIRTYRPSYRFLRGDPVMQAESAEDLAGLEKSRGGRASPAETGRSPLPDSANPRRSPLDRSWA
jgi:hypothetical protein